MSEQAPQERLDTQRMRLQTKAIILGYIMSRMDDRYLAAREVSTWQEAYHEAERATGERANEPSKICAMSLIRGIPMEGLAGTNGPCARMGSVS